MPENSGHAESAKLFLAKMGIRDVRVDLQRGIGRAAKRMASPEPMQELCGECWKGKLCVTSAGRAYPCVFSRFADLGAATDGIRSIATGHLLLDFRARLKRFREEREDSSAPIISEAEATGLSLRAGCDPACAPTRCSPCDPSGFERCVPKCLPSANWYWGEKDFEEGLRGARVSIEAERATSSNLSTPSPAPRGARKPCDPLSSKCDPNVFPRKPPAGVTPENAVGGAK
jgi:hypothetical protein